MKGLIETIKNLGTVIDKSSWTPLFFNLTNDGDSEKLNNLIIETPGISVHNEIENQLEELVKSLYPIKKLKGEALKEAVKRHVGETPLDEYGNWVYYPWSKRLVHILEEEDYIFARTSRNMYKITPEEQAELRKKKIGVIGLSVGQSVSLTLAMERICGEIRLTDFDILELTNLNRIRTGVHTIGLKKVYAVAREIAEIDPYIKVRCFPEGLHEENMDSFFLENGKLDLLIEESDGFDIKVLSRFKAKELKIPVLMEASDRCMVDVERFDLEVDRPILHGLINHLDPAILKTLKTNEEKIPYMLDILGIDSMSTRIKASMLEIDQTITTWPQLASAVIMGGGVTADVARRMLLGTFTDSGRYWVDVEELIGNKHKGEVEELRLEKENDDLFSIAKSLIDKDLEFVSKLDIELKHSELKDIVEAACLAPSGGNSQPWKWYYKKGILFLINPFSGENSILGCGNRANYVAQGASLENLVIKSSRLGYKAEVNLFPKFYSNKDIIAEIKFEKQINSFKYENLEDAIGLRLTNRKNEGRVLINPDILEDIKNCVGEFGSSLEFYSDVKDLENFKLILGEAERIRILEDIGHKDFVNELRWSDEEAQRKKDGIELGSIDLSASERAGLFVAKNPNVIKHLREWNLGSAFSKLTFNTVESASAIGVLRLSDWSEQSFVNGGRILERIWLKANQLGISFQPTAASVFMYFRLLEANKRGYSENSISLLNQLLPKYDNMLNISSNKNKVIFIFRLSEGINETQRSIRKPVEDVLCLN